MRLWTAQGVSVLRQLEAGKTVHVDAARVGGAEAAYSYRWLVAHLSEVIPGYGGSMPWWFYADARIAQWKVSTSARPWPTEEEVLLELEIPRLRIFTMRSWAWDRALRGAYLALSKREHLDWRKEMRRVGLEEADGWTWMSDEPPELPQPLERRRRASLERLFTTPLPPRPWRWSRRLGYAFPRGTEAVSEALRPEDLVAVHVRDRKPGK